MMNRLKIDQEWIQKVMQEGIEDHHLVEQLLRSFSIDQKNSGVKPDQERGYQRVVDLVRKTKERLTDTGAMLSFAPFTYAYLGEDIFQELWNVALDRAQSRPEEQPILYQIFTGASLVKPQLRKNFVEAVRTAPFLDEPFYMDMLISGIDPSASFTTPDEFPQQFHTSDVRKATNLLGLFQEMGLFEVSTGFNDKYKKAVRNMGSLDFMLSDPTNHRLLITDGNLKDGALPELGTNLETTPNVDSRPNNNGENPALVVVNQAVPLEQVAKWYRQSTIIYLSGGTKQERAMREVLGENKELIFDNTNPEARARMRHLLKYVAEKRSAGQISLTEMLQEGVKEAEGYAQSGNEHFFRVRDTLESIGKRALVDEIVRIKGYTLPLRSDDSLILFLWPSADKDSAKGIGEGINGGIREKKIRIYHSLEESPLPRDEGLPFLIVSGLPLENAAIQAKYPSTAVMYLARDGRTETEMRKANPRGDAFVVTMDEFSRERTHKAHYVGISLVEMFFEEISKSKGKGIRDMMAIVKDISSRIATKRNEILFAPEVRDTYRLAAEYFTMQERYRTMPLMLQMDNPVLMTSCPTGGCFNLNRPDAGGCCGGGNLPEVLIDFAIAYRKQVGEQAFLQELKAYHKDQIVQPWYLSTRHYQRSFQGLPTAEGAGKKGGRMRF
jgi:hypothetical protein